MIRTALFGSILSVGLTVVTVSEALANCSYDLNGVGYGDNCPYRGRTQSVTPQPQGPSPEELRQQHEAKDLDEATQDAWDRGVARYHAGDWAGAIKYFREGLSYDPDNEGLKHNLAMAEQHQADAQAALRQPNDSPTAHVLKTMVTSGGGSGAGFDTKGGADVGGVSVPFSKSDQNSGDPVVPPGRRTPAIKAFEAKREKDREEVAALDVKLKALDPATNVVEIAALKQKKTTAEHKIHYLNFEISEAIAAPKK